MSIAARCTGRLVAAVLRCSRWLMPARHAEWIVAMEAETAAVANEFRRLCWALGCLSVAVARRVDAVLIGNLKISRWVLAPELLLCFGPLAFAWTDVVWGASGLMTLTPAVVDQFFLNSPRGTFMLIYTVLEAVLGILGPIALGLGITFVIFNRPILSRRILVQLMAVAAAIGLLLTARLVFDLVAPDSEPKYGSYAALVLLFAILPAAGLMHMYYLGGAAGRPAAAR